MIWQDKGILLSKNRYNENSAIAEFYTENYGKISGVIFGATSKKLKNYLFIGNKFHINFNSKSEDKIGYFKIEIDKVNTPVFLNNQKKLFCIIYAMNLIKILMPNNLENKNIFNLINDFFIFLINDDWLINFVFWELNLFKIIGYDIDFKNYVKKIKINDEEKFIVESSQKIIPNFLISKNNNPVNHSEIIKSLNIVGDFLEKSILKPNNINYPNSRLEFLNLIK